MTSLRRTKRRRFLWRALMRRLVLVILGVASLGWSASGCSLLLAGDDDAPPAIKKDSGRAADAPSKSGDKGGTKDVIRQWAELLARREKITRALEALDEKSRSADFAGKRKIEEEFRKLRTEF